MKTRNSIVYYASAGKDKDDPKHGHGHDNPQKDPPKKEKEPDRRWTPPDPYPDPFKKGPIQPC